MPQKDNLKQFKESLLLSSLKPYNTHHMQSIKNEQGVAIILVTLLIAVGTILVTSIAFSTFISGRTYGMVRTNVQGEYMLKSMFNFSVALLQKDTNATDHGNELLGDAWGFFFKDSAVEVPSEVFYSFGLEQFPRVKLRIAPTNRKLPIFATFSPNNPPSQVSQSWNEIFKRLFEDIVDFENLPGEDHLGYLPNHPPFSSEECLSNYVDYVDSNKDSSRSHPSFDSGVEDDLPEDTFPAAGRLQDGGRLSNFDELGKIPGFTPERLEAIEDFVTVRGDNRVNINVVKDSQVFDAIFQGNVNLEDVRAHIETVAPFTSEGDFTSNFSNSVKSLSSLIVVTSDFFEIECQVSYGGNIYNATAYVEKSASPPELEILWNRSSDLQS